MCTLFSYINKKSYKHAYIYIEQAKKIPLFHVTTVDKIFIDDWENFHLKILYHQ